MNIRKKKLAIESVNDANLVMYSLGGDRDAFSQIVTRYQNLLCSLAYSAVGDLRYSEDIAQEAFVDAWRKLDTLQEPEKLKAWLCGILRFKITRFHRSESKHYINVTTDAVQPELSPSETLEKEAIGIQEQSLMWNVLNTIDDAYREPLILFYREQQSVERVAKELDISVDTAKQRLSRGRKFLKQAMLSVVEEGLANSKPSVTFTAGVMGIISSISPSTKAAVIGTAAIKSSSMVNLTAILALVTSFTGLISSYFGLKAALAQSKTKRERAFAIKSVTLFIVVAMLFVLSMLVLEILANWLTEFTITFTIISQILVIVFVASYFWLVHYVFSSIKFLRAKERIFKPNLFNTDDNKSGSKRQEYRSRFSFLGVPVIHVKLGMHESGDSPAFGWIAGGSVAYGLLFAWGGVAIAPISVGIIAAGVISIGAVGIGLLGIGTVAIGYIGFGASSIAYKAFGSLSALGWESAISGGFSIAKQAAIAPFAYAAEINSDKAAELSNMEVFNSSLPWLLLGIAVLVIIPAIWYSVKVQQRMK